MKAVIYNEFGGIDVLELAEIPVPELQEKQVLLKIKAVSINPIDWKIRKGEMKMMSGSKFPKRMGGDFAGIIEKIHPSLTEYKIGDQVFGAVKGMKDGALAEYIAIDVNSIWPKPKAISFEQACCIPVVGAAAYKAIEEIATISIGSKVLINGCSGGIGMFAVQLAKQRGAIVTGVCGTKAIEFAKKIGCDTVLDYSKTNLLDLTEQFDVVLELSGKLNFKEAKKFMKPNSVFINPIPTLSDILKSPFVNIGAKKKNRILLGSVSNTNMNFILKAIEKGLSIEVSKTFPIENVKEAYQFAEKGGYIGKVVITLN